MLAFGGQPFRHSGREGLELLARVAVHIEIAAERVAHFIAPAARVLAEHEDAPFPTQLVHAGAMMPRHGQNQIGLLDELAGEETRAMSGEIQTALETDEICPDAGAPSAPSLRVTCVDRALRARQAAASGCGECCQ
jgi:hypothetical protein